MKSKRCENLLSALIAKTRGSIEFLPGQLVAGLKSPVEASLSMQNKGFEPEPGVKQAKPNPIIKRVPRAHPLAEETFANPPSISGFVVKLNQMAIRASV
jgi:hypothetical protein